MKKVPPESARFAAPMNPPLLCPMFLPVFSSTGPCIHASSPDSATTSSPGASCTSRIGVVSPLISYLMPRVSTRARRASTARTASPHPANGSRQSTHTGRSRRSISMEELEKVAKEVNRTSRATFLRTGAVAGAGIAAASLLPGSALAALKGETASLTAGDVSILSAAAIAEALAVTTYTNIITTAPFFKNLESDDQGYLVAARD